MSALGAYSRGLLIARESGESPFRQRYRRQRTERLHKEADIKKTAPLSMSARKHLSSECVIALGGIELGRAHDSSPRRNSHQHAEK